MSGAEIFALVTGVMTVISFAADTAKVCKALYDGTADADLTDRTAPLRDACKEMQAHCDAVQPHTAEERDLVDLARKCELLSVDLLQQVDSMRVRKKSVLATARAALKSFKGKSKIQKCEENLAKYQDVLKTTLLVRLW